MADHTSKLLAAVALAGGGWFVYVLSTRPTLAALLAAAFVVPALLAAVPYALVRGHAAVDRRVRRGRPVCVPGTDVCVGGSRPRPAR